MPAWLLYSLLTVLLWGVWGFESKLLMQRTSPYTGQVLFTFGLLIPAGLVLLSRNRFAGAARLRGFGFALLTGLLGGLGNVAFYMALVHGKSSVVVALGALSPLVTVLLAMLVLGERITNRQRCGLALALVAIYMLSS